MFWGSQITAEAAQASYDYGSIYIVLDNTDYDGMSGDMVLNCKLDNYSSYIIPVCRVSISLPSSASYNMEGQSTLSGFDMHTTGSATWTEGIPDGCELSTGYDTVSIVAYNIPPDTAYRFSIPCSGAIPEPGTGEGKVTAYVGATITAEYPGENYKDSTSDSYFTLDFTIPPMETQPETESVSMATESDAYTMVLLGTDSGVDTPTGETQQIDVYTASIVPEGTSIQNQYITRYVQITEKTRGIWPVLLGAIIASGLIYMIIKRVKRYRLEHKRKFEPPDDI